MEDEKKSVEVPVAGASVAADQTAPLRPSGKPVLSDPMAGRDTDTGNLEILTNTATRKTVKLKPIAPHPVVNPASRLSITPSASIPKPAPLASGTVKPAAPAAPAPAPAKPEMPAMGTRPVFPPKSAAPATSASDEDQTVRVPKMAPPAAQMDTSADKATVKLPPPPRRAPAATPASVKPVMPATGARPVPPSPVKSAPGMGTSMPATKLPAMGKPAVPQSAPVAPEAEEIPETSDTASNAVFSVPAEDGEEEFGKGCSIMRGISMVLLACTVIMMLLQFVDILCGTSISSIIPGMPFSK